MNGRFTNFILILALLIGLSLLLYPTAANWWNELHQATAITLYSEKVSAIDAETYKRLMAEAAAYNGSLLTNELRWYPTESETEAYKAILNVDPSLVMGRIDIPSIDVSLPVYHTVEEPVLQRGVGHLEGSSLPIGEEGTHCVLTGHRGLPSALLFTHLDKVTVGDVFTLTMLDEVLSYEVDRILIVEPQEVASLAIEEGADLCTLVTCTPYAVNSHRLLVRGHRVTNKAIHEVRVSSDAAQIAPTIIAPFIALLLLLLLLAWLLFTTRRRRRVGEDFDVPRPDDFDFDE